MPVAKKQNHEKLDKVLGGAVPCVYKWGWSTIKLMTGQTNSCHRTFNSTITPTNFNNFHNTTHKIRARKTMNQAEWPGGGCEYCKTIEQAGGISDRMDVTTMSNYDELVPKENAKAGSSKVIRTTPTMVEVYFTNVCNMNCVYCNPQYSTVWQQEVQNNPDDESLLDYRRADMPIILPAQQQQAMVEKFFEWLHNNSQRLVQLRILGGEPFFQPETYRTIDYFENSSHPNLNLMLFSNLKVPYDKFCSTVDRLQTLQQSARIKNIVITCSIDCWGAASEYTRTGLDLAAWESNFAYLTQHSSLQCQIHGTMNSLSIHTLAQLLDKRNSYQTQRPIHYNSNICTDPSILHPGNWPSGTWDTAFDQAFERMTRHEQKIHQGYKMMIDQHPAHDDIQLHTQQWLDNFDRRRGTNWRTAFPWLQS